MDKEILLNLLKKLYSQKLTPEEAIEEFKFMPFQDINHTKIDTHRVIRSNLEEVIFGQNKTVEELKDIINFLQKKNKEILITKLQKTKANKLIKLFSNSKYFPRSKILIINEKTKKLIGNVVIISAGTSDLPIAEEAYITAKFFGSNAAIISDVGIAGIHRLLNFKEQISKANIIIAVAGMEGALPSVVAGIFGKPIVAVPTSIGYGTSLNGISALLTMLNSCTVGITVVNIDNGFGAGTFAHIINSMISQNNKF